MSEIKYPTGYKSAGKTKIAVAFDDKDFADIIRRAKREKKTFNEMVLSLVACGKLCLDESDKLEAA